MPQIIEIFDPWQGSGRKFVCQSLAKEASLPGKIRAWTSEVLQIKTKEPSPVS